ncbi:MAG: SPASM domain-containing protein [Bacteroidales bacterium]|nr:SPASM domain-containing protein [Bacteroidales bacterium]
MKKKLYWSRYNFLVETKDGLNFLFNSYANSLIKIEDALFDSLKHFSCNEDEVVDFKEFLSKMELDFFCNNFILVESDDALVEKMQLREYANVYSRERMSITVAPTQNCNFNCVYCFEGNRVKSSMTEDTENALIRYVKNEVDNHGLRKLTLCWYGGEPLLEMKRIMSITNKLKHVGLDSISQSVVTNGYLFTQRNVDSLMEIGVENIQITIDGVKKKHDSRRPLKNGEGSFDKIVSNLDNYYERSDNQKLQIHIRVNVDKTNKNEYEKMFDWLKTRYPYNNLFVYPGWVHITDESKQFSVCMNAEEKNEMFFDLAKRRGILLQEMYPSNIIRSCSTKNNNSMLVGPDGSIYKCWEDLGNIEKVVGNINNEHIWTNLSLRAKYTVGVDRFQDSVCRECSYLPMCNGGCPLRRYENKYEGKHNNCCTYFKGHLKEYLELHYNMKIAKMQESKYTEL